jgi:hypothetical protein
MLRLRVPLHELGTAETAELAFGRIDLSAILALVHMGGNGDVHAVLNA